jgi:hypothetical protein
MRRRLSYANVVATMALVLSMSGGALAAKHYLLSSTRQISPKVLRSLEAGNMRLFNKLAARVTVAKASWASTAANATSAASAASATNAASAANAAAVGGMTVRKIFLKAPEDSGETPILSLNGLELIASCPAGKAVLTAKSLADKSDAHLTFGTPSNTEEHSEGDSLFEAGHTLDAMAETKRGAGELVDLLDNGTTVTVHYAVDDKPSLGDFHGCVFGGVAIAG